MCRGKDRAAALIETAIVLPVLLLLLVGGLMLGLATVDNIRLERLAGDAARLTESEAGQLINAGGATLVCYWRGEGPGECFDDGLSFARVQVAARGRTWQYPGGSVTPTAEVTRPQEEDPNVDETVDE